MASGLATAAWELEIQSDSLRQSLPADGVTVAPTLLLQVWAAIDHRSSRNIVPGDVLAEIPLRSDRGTDFWANYTKEFVISLSLFSNLDT